MGVDLAEVRAQFSGRCGFARAHWPLPNTENMAILATRHVSDDHHSTLKTSVADDPDFSVVCSRIFHFEVRSRKDIFRILGVQSALLKCLPPLPGIVGDRHTVIVATI